MTMKMNHKLLAAALLSSLLAACGGGGGGGGGSGDGDTAGVLPPGLPVVVTPPSFEDTAPAQTTVPAPSYTSTHRLEAFNRFNEIRQAAGLGLLRQNAQLDTAAQGHSDYLSLNDLIGHYQRPGDAGFTGADPWERMRAAGYAGWLTGSEVQSPIAGSPSGWAHIDALIATPYHRMGMLNYRWDEMGVGYNGEFPGNVTVKMGLGPGQGAPDRLFVISRRAMER